MDTNPQLSHAADLISQQFGKKYFFGTDVFTKAFQPLAGVVHKAFLIHSSFQGSNGYLDQIRALLASHQIQSCGEFTGIQPNAPTEDLYRLVAALKQAGPDILISFGGGSVIDTVKAANVLYCLGGDIDDYFGTGQVTERWRQRGIALLPHLAIQTAASSAAHLTRYSNITNLRTGQKKLIVDDAIVPPLAAFDYRTTLTAPPALTIDGALDGFSHALEVLYSLGSTPRVTTILPIAKTAIDLLVTHLHPALDEPQNLIHRTALGMGTDLGGAAIMIGGTNGGHLTSFSLVDLLPHGRACAMLNPYYTVFFAPAIQASLQMVGSIFQKAGYLSQNLDKLHGRKLGLAVAQAMLAFLDSLGYPTTLNQIAGFDDGYIERALTAAKNPQLAMKLRSMPIPIASESIDDIMGAILKAAASGDFSIIPTVS